jgi:uncharacterized membrane protein YgcG
MYIVYLKIADQIDCPIFSYQKPLIHMTRILSLSVMKIKRKSVRFGDKKIYLISVHYLITNFVLDDYNSYDNNNDNNNNSANGGSSSGSSGSGSSGSGSSGSNGAAADGAADADVAADIGFLAVK